MTEMLVLDKQLGSISSTDLFTTKFFHIATSAGQIQRFNMKADSLINNYRFNPFTNSIVEIDPTQAWFWTPDWLEGELEVEKEILSGTIEVFENIEDIFDM